MKMSLLPFGKDSPLNSNRFPHQLETVVYGADGAHGVTGHSGTNTGGGVYCQSMQQLGNLDPGLPTVSPIVK